MTDIDPFPVAALPDRFSTSKQTVYTRMEALGISPFKQGKRAYIHLDRLRQLDALHDHLAAGGHLQDFAMTAIETHPVEGVDVSNYSRSNTDAPLTRLVNAAESLTGALMDVASPDPISNLRRLQEAADNGWLLTTSQVRELTGAKPHGPSWRRGSFEFRKRGKIGREAAWGVERSSRGLPKLQQNLPHRVPRHSRFAR